MTRDEASLLAIIVVLLVILLWWASRRLSAEPWKRPWTPRYLLRTTAGFTAAIAGVTAARWFLDGSADWAQVLDYGLGMLAGIGVLAISGAVWEATTSDRR